MKRDRLSKAEAALKQFALGFPEAFEDFPWDHWTAKVRRKIFVILDQVDHVLRLTVKLPVSARTALTLPFTSPTEYGLGKSGWVTARFAAAEDVPVEMLAEWIDESYRAIAPKKLIALLEKAEADGKHRLESANAPARRKR